MKKNVLKGILCGLLGLVISLAIGSEKPACAASSQLSKEEYQSQLEQLIQMAEYFRGDDSFIYEANSALTEEERTALINQLDEIFSNAGADTDEEKLQAILAYVHRRMGFTSTTISDCPNAYVMLLETPDSTYVGNSEHYAQAVQTLCALAGFPALKVGDGRELAESYEVVMVYLGEEWVFIDGFQENQGILSQVEAYEGLKGHFQPTKVNFGYIGGNSLIGYAASIFMNAELLNDDTQTNVEFNLLYDSELDAVVMAESTGAVIKNGNFYGAKQRTDAEGRVPTGMVDFTCGSMTESGKWEFYQGYSQQGVLLSGQVTIDEEEHNFEMGSFHNLMYREQIEVRELTTAEREEYNSLETGRLELAAKVAEATIQDSTYEFFADATEEEMAYFQEAAAEAVSLEWLTKQEALLEVYGLTVPKEGEEISEKVKAIGISSYINDKVSYIGGIVALSNYEVLTGGQGTCQNYASVMTLLSELNGIECFTLGAYLSGSTSVGDAPPKLYSDSGDHACNVLKLDGEWYMMDSTEGSVLWDTKTLRGRSPNKVIFADYSSTGIYFSYEMMLRDATNPMYGLCYDFDAEGNLEIYYMSRSGPVANYECRSFATDENGKLLQNNGFVTWEVKSTTDTGYEMHLYEGYARHGFMVPGTQTINGVEYEFPRGKVDQFVNSSMEFGYFKEVSSRHYLMYKMDISEVPESFTYTGEKICPKPVIKNGEKTLVEGTDYTMTYYNNRSVSTDSTGDAYVIIEGKGNYYDQKVIHFSITTKEITEADVTVTNEEFIWNINHDKEGSYIEPEVIVDAPASDYTISYTGFGTTTEAKIYVKGRYNCSGTVVKTYSLQPISIENGDFVITDLSSQSFVYKQGDYEPEVEVCWNNPDGTLYRKLDYADCRITYENNKEAGTAKVIVEGEGHFTGRLETTFTIEPYNLSKNTKVQEIFNHDCTKLYYTGEAQIPQIPGVNYIAPYVDKLYYTEGVDYTLSFEDNINAGDITATLQGIGNYTGTLTRKIRIHPKEISWSDAQMVENAVEWTGTAQKPEITLGNLVAGEDFEVTCQKLVLESSVYEDVEAVDEGQYYVYVEITNPNYAFTGGERGYRMQFFVIQNTGGTSVLPTPSAPAEGGQPQSPTESSLPIETQQPSGDVLPRETKKPSVEEGKASSSSGSNGSEIPDGEKGNGEETDATFVLNKVQKVKVTAKKKALLVKWKKWAEADGYQIQISTNKKFKNAKKISLNQGKLKYNVKELKSKQKYFVRIRAYKMITEEDGQKKIWSKWVCCSKKTK